MSGFEPDELIRLMGQDKKVKDGRMTFVMARDIGQAFLTQDVDLTEVRGLLTEECGELAG